ncbi:MAG: single-stranded DNA-binding protein [bacterium]|jgi:single-strand DNA-binding protein
MKAINLVMVSGRLGAAPEVAYLDDGTPAVTFSLAVDRPVKNGDRWESASDWFEFRAAGSLAKTIGEYANKGDELIVQGRLAHRSWTGRDQQVRHAVYVKVDDLKFGHRKRAAAPVQAPAEAQREATADATDRTEADAAARAVEDALFS